MQAIQDVFIHLTAFIAVLSLVVFVHEYGHFRAARWCKVAIDTFSIGFGRTLAGWRDKAGVQWKIGMLPLGGYVKFTDDADPSSTVAAEDLSDDPAALEEARKKGLFHAQPVWVRAVVAAAGPVSNFIFAIVAFAALLMIFGRDVTPINELSPRVDQVLTGSPADKAGIQPGDVILAIDGASIRSFGEMQAAVTPNAGKALSIVIGRSGQRLTVTATPEARKGLTETGVAISTGVLGIARTTLPAERKIERLGPIDALSAGAAQTLKIVVSTGEYVGNIFTGKASAEHIAGPLGIMDMSGQVAKSAGVGNAGGNLGQELAALVGSLIGFAAMLSVAVGIVNLLPIPVLDGGHLLFYAIEAIRGRPLDHRAQMIGFRAGLAVLGSLFLFATWNDLQRLNVLEFLSRILS